MLFGTDVLGLLIICLKSVAVYVFILLAIRIFGKKELSQLSVVDLVFILLISNSVQNAMVGTDSTLLGGLAAASGLFVFNYIVKYFIKRFPKFSKAIQGEELILIYKGKIVMNNLEKSMFSIDELEASVREHGVETIAEVDLAVLEVDGNVSVMSANYTHQTIKKRKVKKIIQ